MSSLFSKKLDNYMKKTQTKGVKFIGYWNMG